MSTKQLRRVSSLLVAASTMIAACDTRTGGPDEDAKTYASDTDAGEDEVEQDPRCRAPAGVSNAPRSVAQVVELLNALPKPLSLPCFLESLARPLRLRAANSEFSAQPAAGARSPRIFMFTDPLIMSVVPAGPGAQLLELGERRSAVTSLKAELEFPITEQLDAEAPYRRVAFNEATTVCGACHQGEKLAADVGLPLAFISQSLRPIPNQHVPLAKLMTELDACDAAEEPARCALLEALLSPTPAPLEGDFPSTFNTFF